MLEGIDEIDWKNLEHAYGDASDVPQLIRNLASDNEEERYNALWELYGNIFHQGTRYEATPYAIPFIFDLIREPNVPDKAILIRFTVDLALGYPEAFLPKGPNVDDWLENGELLEEEGEDDEEREKWVKHIDSFIKSYRATLNEVPTYWESLKSEEFDIKLASIFALAWFREEANKSSRHILRILENENDEILLMNALISLSILDSYIGNKSHEVEFSKRFSNGSSLIKIASSIALINIFQDEVNHKYVDYLIRELPNISKIENNPYNFPWNDGDMLGYVSEVLKYYAIDHPKKIINSLCNTLQNLTGEQAVNVTASLLWIVFPEPPQGDHWTLREMSKHQILVLNTLASNSSIWKLEDTDFENFALLMGEYGLPTNISNLRKFLEL